MPYSLLDSTGRCVNVVSWDGESDWQPPEGLTLVAEALQIGSRYDLIDDVWTLAEPPTLPVVPRWVQFGAALAADPSVNAMVGAAITTAPVLHLMLGVGLGQAAQGDPQTFATAWSNARAAGLVSPELAAHVADLAAQFNLPAEFIAELTSTPEEG